MKIRKFRKVVTLILVFSFAMTMMVSAQEKIVDVKDAKRNPDGSYSSTRFNEAEKPEDSYLAKFHATDVVHKLVKKNLEQIYLLKVIVSNFKDKGWSEDYKRVYSEYKAAMELFYKRNIIYARLGFENNKKSISDLMKKMCEEYEKDTDKLLMECAEKILELHLDSRTRSDPNKHRELANHQMRLRIAYGQFDDAISAMIDHNFEAGIYHFRVSKSFGIKILQGIVKPEEEKGVKDKYKYHKADNMNRILDRSGVSSASATTTTDKGTAAETKQ